MDQNVPRCLYFGELFRLPAGKKCAWILNACRCYDYQACETDDYETTLAAFIQERDQSVWWLKSLIDPAWNNALNHPGLGPMSGKLFLSNWLAHDYLHLRQIAYTKHAFLKHQTGENLEYAGKW